MAQPIPSDNHSFIPLLIWVGPGEAIHQGKRLGNIIRNHSYLINNFPWQRVPEETKKQLVCVGQLVASAPRFTPHNHQPWTQSNLVVKR